MLWLEGSGRAVPGHRDVQRAGLAAGLAWQPQDDGIPAGWAGMEPQDPGSSAGLPALPLTSSGTARALCHPPERPQPCPLLSPVPCPIPGV